MNPDDLPPHVRRQLLDQVRQQIGGAQYGHLLRAHGEDGILRIVLDQLAAAGASVPAPRKSSGASWGWVIVPAVLGAAGALGALFNAYVNPLVAKKPMTERVGEGFVAGVLILIFGFWFCEAVLGPVVKTIADVITPPRISAQGVWTDPADVAATRKGIWVVIGALAGVGIGVGCWFLVK